MSVSKSLVSSGYSWRAHRLGCPPEGITRGLLSACVGLGTMLLSPAASLADIITTPSSSSVVLNNCNTGSCSIISGHEVGNNLFHSFSEFIIPVGGNVSLITPSVSPPNDIDNVFIRVVDRAAEIHGTFSVIDVGNPVDIIFLSPRGITIGESAQFSYPGNLLLSTAERLDFGSGDIFDATNSNPLPTSIPFRGLPSNLQLGNSPGAINFLNSGLTSPSNIVTPQTKHQFSVIGQAINFDGIGIKTPGSIRVAAVESNQTIDLSFQASGIDFSYDAVTGFGTINLHESSLLTTSLSNSDDAGDIEIIGNNLRLQQNSQVKTLTDAQGGNINLDLTELFVLETDSQVSTQSNIASAITGDISISSREIQLKQDSLIDSFSDNSGGNINLDVVEVIELDNTSQISTQAANTADSNAGNIDLQAQHLTLSDRAKILTETSGNQGNIDLRLSEDLRVTGSSIGSSGIRTQLSGTTGSAGKVSISASNVSFDQGLLQSNTEQPGGNIDVEAAQTIQFNQSRIALASMTGAGHAGNLSLTAQSSTDAVGILLTATSLTSGNGGTGGNVVMTAQGAVELRNGSSITIDSSGNSSGADDNLKVAASAFRSDSVAADNDVLLVQGTAENLSLPQDVTGFDLLGNQALSGNGNSELIPNIFAMPAAEPPITSTPTNPVVTPVTPPLENTPTAPTSPTGSDSNGSDGNGSDGNGSGNGNSNDMPFSSGLDLAEPDAQAFSNQSDQSQSNRDQSNISIARNRLLAFYGSASSTSELAFWNCSPAGENHLRLSGRGGISGRPTSLYGGNSTLADFGGIDAETTFLSAANSSRFVRLPTAPGQSWLEAQTWRRDHHGNIKLVAPSSLVLAQSKADSCQSLR